MKKRGIHILLLSALSVLLLEQCSGIDSKNLRAEHHRFAPCPQSPNCVSSWQEEEDHFIEAFNYEGPKEVARDRLLDVIGSFARVRIVTEEANYIHAEFTSALFGFIDDVEFSLAEGSKTVHVRSASRVGYYDFGVNRKRLEKIRALFSEF